MVRENKRRLALTSVIILLPILVGLVLWNSLPDRVAIHFDINNEPNGWCGKGFAVFGLPCVLLALHWFSIAVTFRDPKRENIHGKMMALLFWLCPAVSLMASAVTYSYALGVGLDVGFIVMLFMGLMLLVLGNYLPKCQPNHVVGIRLPWTLRDPENWRRTHRLAGWSMAAGGVLILATACFRVYWLFAGLLILSVLLPVVYSGVYHYKHRGR